MDPQEEPTSMTDEYVSKWYALIHALNVIWRYADQAGIDPDEINLDSRKIVREYIEPISGDILYEMHNGNPFELETKYQLLSTNKEE